MTAENTDHVGQISTLDCAELVTKTVMSLNKQKLHGELMSRGPVAMVPTTETHLV